MYTRGDRMYNNHTNWGGEFVWSSLRAYWCRKSEDHLLLLTLVLSHPHLHSSPHSYNVQCTLCTNELTLALNPLLHSAPTLAHHCTLIALKLENLRWPVRAFIATQLQRAMHCCVQNTALQCQKYPWHSVTSLEIPRDEVAAKSWEMLPGEHIIIIASRNVWLCVHS